MANLYAAFFPDLSQHTWIFEFRKLHDPKAAFVAPHITLINPTSDFADVAMADEVRRTAEKTNKFEAIFRSAIVMPELINEGKYSAYVFLVPDEGFSRIINLRNELYSGMLKTSLRLDIPFVPHITIGSGLSLDIAKELVDNLNSKPIEIRTLVDKVSLVEISGTQADRKVIQECHLL